MTDDERADRERLLQNERARDLVSAVDLGLAVRQLLDTEVGKRLIRDAEEQRSELVEKLIQAPAHDLNAVSRLQAEIWSIDWWQLAFARYIQNGVQAEIELAQLDYED